VTESAPRDTFKPESFGLLQQAEDQHFWFRGRREIILDVLTRKIPNLAGRKMLEIGCGNGNILRYLHQKTELKLVGGDLFVECLKTCRGQLDLPLYQIDAALLPFRDSFDIIGLFDVLEHIENDEQVLRECYKALKAQGRLILTVPVCPKLWSSFDELSCHKRRYTRKELIDKLKQTGFAIERVSHFMCFLFPIVYILRTLKDRFSRSRSATLERLPNELRIIPIFNSLCLSLLRLEKWLMRYVDLPYGVSLLVLARKV